MNIVSHRPCRTALFIVLNCILVSVVSISSSLGEVVGKQKVEPINSLRLLPKFRAELIYTVPKPQEGSWISMCNGPRGRLIVCAQSGPLYRVTPGTGAEPTIVETLTDKVTDAHGLLYVFDHLYVVGLGDRGSGLYRLRDTNGDDQFDQVELLKNFNVGGEHHGHAVLLGPDQKLYIVCGNFTGLPEGIRQPAPFGNYRDDWLLPQLGPPSGHAADRKPPCGFIVRTDRDGHDWELICGGFRNSFDMAFNVDGELFAYDADMEYDSGTPWYRPCRVNHVLSGADYGWRRGAAKWPTYYADSFSSVIDIGQGSPTGVTFGYGAKFPEKYQRALYLNDWTYGRIRAVHLSPRGATFTATAEDFVVGRPLPLTDNVIGVDGALYFLVGGRNAQSKMYRVTYHEQEVAESSAKDVTGSAGTSPDESSVKNRIRHATAARTLRRQLETFHTLPDPAALDFAWPSLASPDRAIRHAARIAVEHQPAVTWQNRALAETRPQALITASIALIRSGNDSHRAAVLSSFDRLDLARLPGEQLVEALRAYALVFIRWGLPEPNSTTGLADKFHSLLPQQEQAIDHELVRLLVYLKDERVIRGAIDLMETSRFQHDQMFYANALRLMETGWSIEDRIEYFKWLNRARFHLTGGAEFDAGGYFKYSGGRSFRPYVELIRADALKTLTKEESGHPQLSALIEAQEPPPVSSRIVLELKTQPTVWQVGDLAAAVSKLEHGRSFDIGEAVFEAVSCAKCHKLGRFNGDSVLGPDLTAAGNRYSATDLLENIIEPSKVVSDQHALRYVLTNDGVMYTGVIVEDNDLELAIQLDPAKSATVRVAKNEIEERGISRTSRMPNDLLNSLTKGQILDLVAYILSGADPEHALFADSER